jgi:hypothetical protein
MIFDSYGLLSLESRHPDRDSVRGQRYQRLQLSRTRQLWALQRQILQTLMLSQLIQTRMTPLTALMRTISLFLGTALLGLTTMRPVVQV